MKEGWRGRVPLVHVSWVSSRIGCSESARLCSIPYNLLPGRVSPTGGAARCSLWWRRAYFWGHSISAWTDQSISRESSTPDPSFVVCWSDIIII